MKKLFFFILSLVSVSFFLKRDIENIEDDFFEEAKPAVMVTEKEVDGPIVRKKAVEVKIKKKIKKKIKIYENKPYFNQKDKESFIIDKLGNAILTDIVIIGDNAVSQGDVLIGKWDDISRRRGVDGGIKPIVFPLPTLWGSSRIPYSIEEDILNRDEILLAIEYINRETNLEFVKHEDERSWIHFARGSSHCLSYVGKQGGKQDILLAEGCKQREILHEILHAIGFFHEHSREDRDNYLEVIWENIEDKFHAQFYKLPLDFFLGGNSEFDFDSIMLYPPTAFSITPGDYSMVKENGEVYSFDNNSLLSQEDVRRINKAYPLEE